MYFDRTRSRTALTPTERMSYAHTPYEGVEAAKYVYGSGQGFIGTDESISDCRHPGYADAIKHGAIVMGDLSIQKSSRTCIPASFSYGPYDNPPSHWGTERAWGDLAVWIEGRITYPTYITNDVSHGRDGVLMAAYAKMNEPPILVGEILGDLAKTLQMIRRPMGTAAKLLTKMIEVKRYRLKKKAAGSIAKVTADVWLEYRYGWKPIIGDTATAVSELEKAQVGRKQRLVARSQIPFTMNKSWVEEVAGGIPRCDAVTCNVHYTGNGRACGGVIYEVDVRSTPERIAASLGLGIDRLPSTIWELIPLSFVVDWFVNVGQWIQASVPVIGQTVLAAWITTVVEETKNLSLVTHTTLGPDGSYPSQTWNGYGGGSETKTTTVTRDTRPVLSATPTLNPAFPGLIHSVDALGLLAQGVIRGLSNFKR